MRVVPAEIPAAVASAGAVGVDSGTCARSGSSWVAGGSMVAFAIESEGC